MTLGCCTRCDEPMYEIRETHPGGRPKKLGPMLESGTQVEFLLSDGSEVALSFCRPCADALTPADYQPIWERVIAAADPTHPGGAPLLRTKWPVAQVRRRREVAPGVVGMDRRG